MAKQSAHEIINTVQRSMSRLRDQGFEPQSVIIGVDTYKVLVSFATQHDLFHRLYATVCGLPFIIDPVYPYRVYVLPDAETIFRYPAVVRKLNLPDIVPLI